MSEFMPALKLGSMSGLIATSLPAGRPLVAARVLSTAAKVPRAQTCCATLQRRQECTAARFEVERQGPDPRQTNHERADQPYRHTVDVG